jgi:hypothetical protein
VRAAPFDVYSLSAALWHGRWMLTVPPGWTVACCSGESFEFGNQSSWHYIYPRWDEFPTAATAGGLRWNPVVDRTAKATIGYDQAEAHHGYASLKILYSGGSGVAAASNRGIGNEGLFLVEGRDYEGYFFAKAAKPVTVLVMLRNHLTKAVIAKQEVSVGASSSWTQHNFSLTAAAGTGCEGIAPGSDTEVSCHTQRGHMAGPPNAEQGHVCVRCGGEFALGLNGPGELYVDYVFLQPGEWGRFGAGPFFKDGVEVLKAMGITSIRLVRLKLCCVQDS